jgi:hypothetical protein
LQITDLVKRYPTGTEALRGVSLDIAAGEFFGLLGPNGAGKSTLIHCTTGLARPTSGTIRVFGHDAVEHYEQARLAVGLAPQELNLDWFLTLEESLDYHGGYFGMPKRERRERTKELLLAFSLGGFLRGMLVATLTFLAASLLVDIPVDHVLVLVPALFLVGFFFAQLGVLIGVRAEQFDDVSFAQTFVLQPLIFLGGVFYSGTLLPEPFQTITHFNPVYYMIGLVRYGFLGYSEANVALSLALLTVAALALFTLNHRLFARGYRLRA